MIFSAAISHVFVELVFYRFTHVLSAIEVHMWMQKTLLNLILTLKNSICQAITQQIPQLSFKGLESFHIPLQTILLQRNSLKR